MFKRKAGEESPRRIWRMTAENPTGEFVFPSHVRARPLAAPDAHGNGLRESSWLLQDGLELTETDMTTLPGEWADEFLKGRD